MLYFYKKRKFDIAQQAFINAAKKKNINKEILDIATTINNGKSVFSAPQIGVITQQPSPSIEQIRFISKLNKNGESVYDDEQMRLILRAFKENLSQDKIEMLTKLNDKEEPIYDGKRMFVILNAFDWDIPLEIIETISKLNSQSKPIFTDEEMYLMFHSVVFTGARENVDIFTKVENDKAVYSTKEIQYLTSFFIHADVNSARQIREYIDEGMTFDQIKPLIKHIPDSKMIRICRSLYDLEFSTNSVDFLISNCNYEEIKEIKYITNCMNEFLSDVELNLSQDNFNVDYFREIAAAEISKTYNSDIKVCELLEECLSERMSPEEIKEKINETFSLEELASMRTQDLNTEINNCEDFSL